MKRARDEIAVETSVGGCALYSNVELVNDMHGAATLTLTVGDDGSWKDLSRIFFPGEPCRLFCNGRLLFTGRWEANNVATTTMSGAIARLTARTKFADARYTTADVKTKVTDVSIKQFILALFAPLGYVETDFVFDATTDRNLVTGIRGRDKAPVDLDTLQESKAKVQPGEEIATAATRHLKRYHLAIWEGADGKLVVGAPNDKQLPIAKLRCKRVGGTSNNISAPTRTRDWSELAQRVEVFGSNTNSDAENVPLRGIAIDQDVVDVFNKRGQFARNLRLPLDGPKSLAKADAQAKREIASRRKEKDSWTIETDSWSYWDGNKLIPWALNTTVDVEVDSIGAEATGRYLIHNIVRSLDVVGAASCSLSLAAPGVLEF